MKLRPSRLMRARLAKKHGHRIARDLRIHRKGLSIEGTDFPYWIGEDIEVTRYSGTPLALVTLTLFTERLTVDDRLPRGTTITVHEE